MWPRPDPRSAPSRCALPRSPVRPPGARRRPRGGLHAGPRGEGTQEVAGKPPSKTASPPMAKRKSPPKKTRKPARKPARRSAPEFKLPTLEPHHVDLIGLGLVGLAAFFAPVFYLDWDGGKVGEALASGFVFLLGGVAYLVPVALFATGTLIVLRPLLPTLRPFRAGAICLVLALMLGLAGTLFGLGPSHPPRHEFFQADYFRDHGGAIGEGLYYATSTLFSRFGSYLIFVFLLVAGVVLLTGASIAGVSAATRDGMAETRRRMAPVSRELEYDAPTGREWAEPLD